jgi:hypothetical protein
MSVLSRRTVHGVVVVIAMLHGIAAADGPALPNDDDRAVAKDLFEKGRLLMDAGKFDAACENFAASAAKVEGIGTWLNLGDCQEKTSHLLEARQSFVYAAKLAGDTDRRSTYARSRINTIEARLGIITITTTQPRSELTFVLNGKLVAPEESPVVVVPGSYKLDVTSPQHTAWQKTFTIDANGRLTIDVPELEATAIVKKDQPLIDDPGPRRNVRRRSWVVASLALGGGAVVVGAVATYVGLSARSNYRRIVKQCDPAGCNAEQAADTRDAQHRADIASGLWVGAAAVAGSAITVWLLAPKDNELVHSLAIDVSTHSVGISAAGRF